MLIRAMTPQDVEAVLVIQEPASVRALALVFPQDTHPFPREALRARWSQEVGDPGISCWVAVEGDTVVGFFALRGSELQHFGSALDRWGTGVAQAMHHRAIAWFTENDVQEACLWVFEDNPRARSFYERQGWLPSGGRRRSDFAPHPVLLEYGLRTW